MQQVMLLTGSYILGSLPFGLLIVKAWRGVDIRDIGSGNIGATNAMRTAERGQAMAIFAVVLIADALKGFIPVAAARTFFPESPWVIVGAGLLAILGHTLSVFLRFKGGKGVATALGVIIGLDPRIAAMGFLIWALTVAVTRYVSVGSMVAAVSIVIMMFLFELPPPFIAFGCLAAAFIIFKHRSNISRLLQGKEARWGENPKNKGANNG